MMGLAIMPCIIAPYCIDECICEMPSRIVTRRNDGLYTGGCVRWKQGALSCFDVQTIYPNVSIMLEKENSTQPFCVS